MMYVDWWCAFESTQSMFAHWCGYCTREVPIMSATMHTVVQRSHTRRVHCKDTRMSDTTLYHAGARAWIPDGSGTGCTLEGHVNALWDLVSYRSTCRYALVESYTRMYTVRIRGQIWLCIIRWYEYVCTNVFMHKVSCSDEYILVHYLHPTGTRAGHAWLVCTIVYVWIQTCYLRGSIIYGYVGTFFKLSPLDMHRLCACAK